MTECCPDCFTTHILATHPCSFVCADCHASMVYGNDKRSYLRCAGCGKTREMP